MIEISNIKDLYNLALQENDEEIIIVNLKIDKVFNDLKKNEINCFLSGENDDYDIYLEIHAEQEELRAKIGPICLEECI